MSKIVATEKWDLRGSKGQGSDALSLRSVVKCNNLACIYYDLIIV